MTADPADDIARRCADQMWADDKASRALGMALEEIAAGRARMSMLVAEHMTNGHGMCHGGFIFTLADSAFAFACNSRNERAVAAQGSISFLAPAQQGEKLVAHAEERYLLGRGGIYDVTVTGDEGRVIAEFRGHSRLLGRKFFEDTE